MRSCTKLTIMAHVMIDVIAFFRAIKSYSCILGRPNRAGILLFQQRDNVVLKDNST